MTDERKHLPISDLKRAEWNLIAAARDQCDALVLRNPAHLKPEETALIEAVHEYDYQRAKRTAFAEVGNGR
jgi:hypothetical protein